MEFKKFSVEILELQKIVSKGGSRAKTKIGKINIQINFPTLIFSQQQSSKFAFSTKIHGLMKQINFYFLKKWNLNSQKREEPKNDMVFAILTFCCPFCVAPERKKISRKIIKFCIKSFRIWIS